jgi:hypothetical protein
MIFQVRLMHPPILDYKVNDLSGKVNAPSNIKGNYLLGKVNVTSNIRL